MPQYKLCSLDQHGRLRRPAQFFDCETDQEIIEKARQSLDGLDIEVWDGPRRVIFIKSSPR
jgi:hypothetical protein